MTSASRSGSRRTLVGTPITSCSTTYTTFLLGLQAEKHWVLPEQESRTRGPELQRSVEIGKAVAVDLQEADAVLDAELAAPSFAHAAADLLSVLGDQRQER